MFVKFDKWFQQSLGIGSQVINFIIQVDIVKTIVYTKNKIYITYQKDAFFCSHGCTMKISKELLLVDIIRLL